MLKGGNFLKYIDDCVWILKYNASCVRFGTAFVVILRRQGCQFSKIILVQLFVSAFKAKKDLPSTLETTIDHLFVF